MRPTWLCQVIYTLLGDMQQRSLLLSVSSDPHSWPRLRTLFGAPPYEFLRAGDLGSFRAAGVAFRRTRMVHDSEHVATNCAQFGQGHFIDDAGRLYRIVRRGVEADHLPLPTELEQYRGTSIILQVRVKRISRTKRSTLLKTDDWSAIAFPRVDSQVVLRATKQMLPWNGKPLDDMTSATLTIKRLIPRHVGSLTAAVIALMH